MEQGGSRASGSSSAPIGLASASNAASDAGGFFGSTRKLLLVSSTNEGHDEGSATKLIREIERMQDRCARLGALVARLGAAQQREQQGGDGDKDGEKGLEQMFAGQGEAEQQRQNVYFAAEEVQLHLSLFSVVVVGLDGGVGLFSSRRSTPAI